MPANFSHITCMIIADGQRKNQDVLAEKTTGDDSGKSLGNKDNPCLNWNSEKQL